MHNYDAKQYNIYLLCFVLQYKFDITLRNTLFNEKNKITRAPMSQIKVQTNRTKCAKEDELGILPTCSRFFCLKDIIHALKTFQYLERFLDKSCSPC